MSLEVSVDFNEKMREMREKQEILAEERAALHAALARNVAHQAALERDLEAECAKYIDRFDCNKDGHVTPMEILKSLFCSVWPSDAEDIVKAMFTADEDGNAVVSTEEFTRAMRAKVLAPQESKEAHEEDEI